MRSSESTIHSGGSNDGDRRSDFECPRAGRDRTADTVNVDTAEAGKAPTGWTATQTGNAKISEDGARSR